MFASLCCVPQDWDESLFEELRSAGGNIYSNYAVGYNNVDVKAATKAGIPVGNTPGEFPFWPPDTSCQCLCSRSCSCAFSPVGDV